jgi:4-amino-4-deoxy-L-arabinose transferase-like glycosyltransferase
VPAIVLLGFALRLWRLAQLGDLEFDEIVSVRYAALPGPALVPLLAGALFEHPPAFYLALGWWRTAFGTADGVARLFSVLPGTLSIPLAYAVSRRLFAAPSEAGLGGRRPALLAALLVAVAPLPLFYSREARMYALVAALGLASLWLFLRGLAPSPPRPAESAGRGASRSGLWIAYTLVGAVTAYVHYLGALQIAGQALAAVLVRRRAPWALRPVAFSTAAVAALALPWALVAQGTRASLPALAPANLAALPGAIWGAWRDLAAGPEAAGVAATIGALALFGLAVAGLPRRPVPRTVTAVSLGTGLAGLVFAVALGKPVQARYVLPVAPLVFILAANTLSRSARLALAGAVGLLAGFLPFWWHYYGDYARADYSAITRRVAALERPGDGVLLTGPWQAWYFDYYYPRSGGALSHEVLPLNAPPALDPAAADRRLEAIAQEHRRLWFVQAGLAQADPTNYVERWLLRHAWPATREAHQNAVLSQYALQPPRVTRPLRPVTFGDRLRLVEGSVDGEEVPAGDVVRLTLELEALRPLPADYKASLRLAGLDGQRTAVDFDLVDRQDEDERGTSGWAPGTRVTVRRGIWAPASLGPQPYSVRLVVYDPGTLAPLVPDGSPSAGAEGLTPDGEAPVGDVYVTQSLAALPAGAETPYRPLPRRFGGGDDFDAVDLVGVRPGQSDPGAGPLGFDLLWRLGGLSGTEHRSTISVVDAAGTVWAEETRPLFGGTFAMHDWREGETLAERRTIDLTALPPGHYRVQVGLVDARGRPLPLAGPGPSAEGAAVDVAAYDLPYHRPLTERIAARIDRLSGRLGGLLGRPSP